MDPVSNTYSFRLCAIAGKVAVSDASISTTRNRLSARIMPTSISNPPAPARRLKRRFGRAECPGLAWPDHPDGLINSSAVETLLLLFLRQHMGLIPFTLGAEILHNVAVRDQPFGELDGDRLCHCF